MAAHLRIHRSRYVFRRRRSAWPTLEHLEARLVLSQLVPGGSSAAASLTPAAPIMAVPDDILTEIPVGNETGQVRPDQSASPVGYTPAQLRGAYGINQIAFGSVIGNGAGQTIAVIDAGDNPSLVPTGSSAYIGSALQVFDQTFNLPDPPSFQKFNQTGGTSLPGPVPTWGLEIALDVEWRTPSRRMRRSTWWKPGPQRSTT